MGNLISTLTMKLIDGVSGVAPRVEGSLKRVDKAAKGVRGGMLGGAMVGGASVAGGLLAGAAGYVSGRAAVDAYKQYADYERAITRILVTAEASAEEATRTKQIIRDIARETALPVSNVTAGLDTLVAAGRTLPEALAFLPAVSRTAQAAGADVIDIAKSADALGASLKIPAENMEEAFDKMAKAGKLGKFELKDMAQYLPSLLPLASSKGFKGMEGLEQVVTYLQMIRTGTGSADEAADSFRDMMGKIASDETVKKFKRFGIDVKKELASVRKAGGNEFDAMFGEGGLMERAMKKGAQVTDLFADIQAYRGALAYRNALAERKRLLSEVKRAQGTVMTDLARVNRDAAAAVQRLNDAWGNMLKSFGNLGDAAGVTTFLERIAENNTRGADAMERFVAKLREGKSLMDAMRAAGQYDQKTPQQIQEEFEREMTASGNLWWAKPGTTMAEINQRQDVKTAVSDGAAARKRVEKALREAQRLAEIAARYPDGKLPPALQAQRDAIADTLRNSGVDEADQRLVDLTNKGLDTSSEDRQHNARRGSSEGARLEGVPLPVPRPDYSPAVEEARRAAAEIMAAFEMIRPTIRPTIVMPEIPGLRGALVGGAINGSASDNGGRR